MRFSDCFIAMSKFQIFSKKSSTIFIPDCDSHSLALLDLFISSDTSICSTLAFPPLGNSDHAAVSISIDLPSNSQQDVPFPCIAYGYSRADLDGLRDHFRDVP